MIRAVRLVCLLAAAGALASCAQQRIRDEAQSLARSGSYEQAMASLDAGLKEYPDSALLRSGAIAVRSDALARLLTDANQARAAGRLEEAQALLVRAEKFDSGGKRVQALLAELAVERRQRAALAEAEALAAKKQTVAALRVVTDALKDNPRQPDLVALQRRLEADARQLQVRATQQGLKESRPISLDFRDANLRTVLDVVSRNSGINFILDKDIRPDTRVTLLLRSARVEDAIDLIVSTHQLAKKVIDPQTILIYPNTPDKQREHQDQVVRVFYLASAEAKGAAAFLRSMAKIREPYVDERTNMLAIRESAENVELAERLIALYDTGEPEVLLEVEVMEVRASRLTDLGVKFPDNFTLTPLGPSGTTGLTLGSARDINSDRIALGVGGLLVNLKREVGDFTTLANPRIRARNKEKAKVMVGDKVPVISAVTSQNGFVSDSVSYIDVGLKLEVEPTVYADDEVAIRINLEVSSLSREVQTNSGSLAYQVGTRNASTLLRLRDGETQLLAGLISKDDRSSASRVPGLGDLPVAGRLFSSQRDETQRTELVLAITPRVLRNIRRPDASETELWVGTEMTPRLRPVGGRLLPSNEETPKSDATSGSTSTPASGPQGQQGPAVPASAPISGRWTVPQDVAIGSTFVATFELSSAVPLRGAPVQLRYPKDKLAVVEIEEGEFFKRDQEVTTFTSAVDASGGTASVGVLRNRAIGANGSATMFRVRFKALAAGNADVAVTGVNPIALGGGPVTASAPVAVTIQVK